LNGNRPKRDDVPSPDALIIAKLTDVRSDHQRYCAAAQVGAARRSNERAGMQLMRRRTTDDSVSALVASSREKRVVVP
jgi:hypothetical protein